MRTIFVLLWLLLTVFLVGGGISLVRFVCNLLIRRKLNPQIIPKKVLIRFFSFFSAYSILFIGIVLFPLINYYPYDEHYLTLRGAIFGDFSGGLIYKQIQTNSKPIVLFKIQGRLYVCCFETGKSPFNLRTYYMKSAELIVSKHAFERGDNAKHHIDDDLAVRDDTLPGIWFGVIYPDDRDKIRINGDKPKLVDIRHGNADYVFWYVENIEEDYVNLTFE